MTEINNENISIENKEEISIENKEENDNKELIIDNSKESDLFISIDITNENKESLYLIDLLKILSNILNTEERINKLKTNIKIKDNEIEFILKLINLCPELFKEISKGLDNILKDNVIDSHDVPYIIKIVKDSYQIITKKNSQLKNITLEDSILFIKNIILILIEYEYIKVNNKENIDLLIELCIDLLQTNLELKINLWDKIKRCKQYFSCSKKNK